MARTSLFVSVVVFSIHLAVCQVQIQTYPSEIKNGLTEELTVNCTYNYLSASPGEVVLSIIISRDKVGGNENDSFVDVAMVNSYTGQAVSQLPGVELDVSGGLQASSGPFLSVSYVDAFDINVGIYECQVSGVDRDGFPFVHQAQAEITGSYPDDDLFVGTIRSLRYKTEEEATRVHSLNIKNDMVNASFEDTTARNHYILKTIRGKLSDITVSANITNDDILVLNTDLNYARDFAQAKADAMLSTLLGEASSLMTQISSLDNAADLLNSSVMNSDTELRGAIEELQALDRILNSTLLGVQSALHGISQRLAFVEKSNDQFQQRLVGIKTLLFSKSQLYQNKQFMLSTNNFHDLSIAEATCRLYNGYLAEIDSSTTHGTIRSFMNNPQKFDCVFVGGTDSITEGHWVFQHSQTSLLYTGWASGEPRSDIANNCRCMSRGVNWNMITDSCYNNYNQTGFLCEMSA